MGLDIYTLHSHHLQLRVSSLLSQFVSACFRPASLHFGLFLSAALLSLFYLFSFVFNNLKSPKVSKAYVFSPDGSSSGHHRRQRHRSHPHLAFVHLPLTSVLQPCSYVVHFATTDWLSGWTRHPSGPMSCNLPVALCLIWQVQTECLCGVFNAASQPF